MILIIFPRRFGSLFSVILLPFLAFLFIVAVVGCISSAVSEYSREASFQQRYGDNWRSEYEQAIGPLSTAHTRMAIAIVGAIAMIAAGTWLVKVLLEQTGLKRPSPRPSRHRHRHTSSIERVTRYKRNALLGLYFGAPGILLSVMLTLYHVGIFAEHSNEMILAIFIFLASYCAAVSGCYWWVKAKAWPEAVTFIAFMPLTVFLIPFVRLIVLANPYLLMTSMVIMPFILFIVVAVLPDKSGTSRRRASWEQRRD